MKLVLSPTKTMAGQFAGQAASQPAIPTDQTGLPAFEQEAAALNRQLARMSPRQIQALFKTSETLTSTILDQIRDFDTTAPVPALFAFRGEAFKTLDPDTFSVQDLAFAEQHLRIFSGLYGILSPLDGIRPYRLDAATPLKQEKKSLTLFWKEKLSAWFREFLGPQEFLLNLASAEYAGLLKGSGLESRIITLQFREQEQDSGKLKNLSVRAKQARGIFARTVITNRIETPDHLKSLSPEGYVYSPSHSSDLEWMFIRS